MTDKAVPIVSEKNHALLAKLAMEKCVVEISFAPLEDDAIDPRGLEALEILIATNPGSQPGPLNKVASGGELSRISLALQVAIADKATAPTMIFDEVDVGVGGAVADVVGGLLRTLSENVQNNRVTHLPQQQEHIISKSAKQVMLQPQHRRYLSDHGESKSLAACWVARLSPIKQEITCGSFWPRLERLRLLTASF